MRRALVLAALVVALGIVPSGAAQSPEVWFYRGGEPGVVVTVANTSIAEAASPGSAIAIDPSEPLAISIAIAPPPGEHWEVRSVSVGLLLRGPGTEPPAALVKRVNASATLPPGFTVVVNRTISLGPIAKLGAGTFLMETTIEDANGTELSTQTFYVRVPASLSSVLTVQGAAITAMSAATGYGLWQIAKDLKELRDAWARHRRKQELARLDVIGKSEHALEETAAKVGKPVASMVALHRAAQDRERGLGPVRWAATGLGLGGVTMAWLQFLGYLALDASGLLITALEVCAAFLTLALVANALLRRRKATPAAPEEPVVSLPIQEGSAMPDLEASEPVQSADKRG